jgi:hypothetical protein
MSELPLWAVGLVGAGIFFILMFLRMHVGLSLMIAGFIGIWLSRGLEPALNTLATTVWRVGNSQYLVVIPLFVLMGIVAGQGGVTESAFNTFNRWVGHLRGGLAMATVGTCAAFGAVCGDNIATAATMDKAALPEMRKYGYDDRLSFGSIAAGGNLGILIPEHGLRGVRFHHADVHRRPVHRRYPAGHRADLDVHGPDRHPVQDQSQPVLGPAEGELGRAVKVAQRHHGILIVFVFVMGGLLSGLFTPPRPALPVPWPSSS